MPVSQAFVLMNLDLVAVPLYAGAAGMVTIYCGQRRAAQLLGGECSRMYAQSTSGRSDSQRTLPPVKRSMAGQCSAGTRRPPSFHCPTAPFVTPRLSPKACIDPSSAAA